MLLNGIMCYLIFCGIGVTHSLLAVDNSEEWNWDADFDGFLGSVAKQDNLFMQENAVVVQRAQEWIKRLDDTVRGIDYDCGKLHTDMRSTISVDHRDQDILEKKKLIGANWAMLCHTKREIQCFRALLESYIALYESEKKEEYSSSFEHYIGMLNAVFSVQQSSEEAYFIREAAFLDKAEYALTRTQGVVKARSAFRKENFQQVLRETLQPYGYAPRSPGAYVCNRYGDNSQKEQVCDYLLGMMNNVFAI